MITDSKMKRIGFFHCVSAFILVSVKSKSFMAESDYCKPAEVGSSYSVTVTIPDGISPRRLVWSAKSFEFPNYVDLCNCTFGSFPPCTCKQCCSASLKMDLPRNVIITVNKDHLKLLHRAKFLWVIDNSISLKTCVLEVYEFSSTPFCSPTKISNSGTDQDPDISLFVSCGISDVFPDASCRSELFSDGQMIERITSQDITITNVKHDQRIFAKYNTTCDVKIPVLNQIPGLYSFHVFFYPNINEGHERSIRIHSSGIQLAVPRIIITKCPKGQFVIEGYVKKGTSATCECQMLDKGNPPGTLRWFDESNRELDSVNDEGKLTLSLTAYAFKEQKFINSYKCVATSPLGKRIELKTDVKYATGPSIIKYFKTLDVYDLCEDSAPISMTCDVVRRDVNPDVKVFIKELDDATLESSSLVKLTSLYRYHISWRPTSGPSFVATCVATNALFEDLRVEKSKLIYIREPPRSRPVMTIDDRIPIQDGNFVNVSEGTTISIKCDVQGGFPPVNEVAINCAGINIIIETHQLKTLFSVTRERHLAPCTCSASHLTGCYHKKTKFYFNVQYGARIDKFYGTLENMTSATSTSPTTQTGQTRETGIITSDNNSTIDVGTNVTFICEAEGRPRPNVKVKGQRSSSLPIQNNVTPLKPHSIRVEATKTMTCTDTGYYVCEANNGIGVPIEDEILIYVKCTPQLSEPGDQDKTFTLEDYRYLKIEISILGHPAPYSFILTKIASRSKRSADGQMRFPDRFNVAYVPTDELYGKIILEMHSLTDDDIGQYDMNIDNGIGEGLRYRFTLAPGSETADSDNDGAILGIVLGIVIFFIILIGLFCQKKVKNSRKSRGRIRVTNRNDQEQDTANAPAAQREVSPGNEMEERPNNRRTSANLEEPIYQEINDDDVLLASSNMNHEYIQPIGFIESSQSAKMNDGAKKDDGYLYPIPVVHLGMTTPTGTSAHIDMNKGGNDDGIYLHPIDPPGMEPCTQSGNTQKSQEDAETSENIDMNEDAEDNGGYLHPIDPLCQNIRKGINDAENASENKDESQDESDTKEKATNLYDTLDRSEYADECDEGDNYTNLYNTLDDKQDNDTQASIYTGLKQEDLSKGDV